MSVNLFDAVNREQFEMRVFCAARYYTVAHRPTNARRWQVDQYKDFAAAALAAAAIPRAILYAVGPYDLAVPLVRARWPQYLDAWRVRLGLARPPRPALQDGTGARAAARSSYLRPDGGGALRTHLNG